jgi:uncharacterized protein (TIGR03435 family)
VIDHTELPGRFNFAFETAAADIFVKKLGAVRPEDKSGALGDGGPAPDSAPSGSSFLTDIQKLGLRLEPRKAPLDFIVVEKGNRVPTEN